MVSEWNRRLSGPAKLVVPTGSNPHVVSIPQKHFGEYTQLYTALLYFHLHVLLCAGNYTKWQKFVANSLPLWKKFILSVLLNDSSPVLVVCYEDVLNSSVAEVSYTIWEINPTM